MRTNLKEVKDAIWDNLIGCFVAGTSEEHIISTIKSYFDVREEQEEVICDIIFENGSDWRNVPCNLEGASEERDAYLNSIVIGTIEELISLLIKE